MKTGLILSDNPRIEVFNEDCMDVMARYPEKYFELAIVDPPYGINFGDFNRTNKANNGQRIKANKYKNSKWDSEIPNDNYFNFLKCKSENQIIWGANYYPKLWVNGCKGFVFWNKGNPVPNFADGELAYTSFDKPARQFDFKYYGNLEGGTTASKKHHPTQKPVALYKWLLQNYAKPGDKILDTHGGSGSILIACYEMGFDIVWTELDTDYYNAAIQRFKKHISQQSLFTPGQQYNQSKQLKIEE